MVDPQINDYPLSLLPAPYDIVWCRFPFHRSLGEPGPKPRPALVRNAATRPDGSAEVEVVYGTTNLKLDQRRFDFVVSKAAEMDACGLYRATRFDLDKLIWLPWTTEWFEIRPDYNSPAIGSLTQHSVKMLQITIEMKRRIEGT